MGTEDGEHLERWMRSWGSDVLRLCRMSLGDAQLAEDALQETFMKVWRSLERSPVQSEEHAKGRIFRTAINVCRDMRRSAWWRNVDTRVALEDLPPPLLAVEDESRELFALVAALPEKLRQPVLLHDLSGLTLEECAKALGLSRPTLSKRLREAYARLAVEWRGEEKP